MSVYDSPTEMLLKKQTYGSKEVCIVCVSMLTKTYMCAGCYGKEDRSMGETLSDERRTTNSKTNINVEKRFLL